MLKDRFFLSIVIIVAILVLEDFDRQESCCRRENTGCAPAVPEPLPCEPAPAPPCRCGCRR